jgi:KDO2-lipid IV(A) lauroyltransferase
MAHICTFLLFSVLRMRRQLILKNITYAFGDQLSTSQKIQLGYDCVYHFILNMLEFLGARRKILSEKVKIIGQEHLTQALAKNQGVYILCAHLGNWEAMGSAFTHQIKKSHIIVKKVGSPKIDAFVRNLRNFNGFYGIERKKKGDAYKAIQEILSKNEIIGFAFDQSRPNDSYIDFFNKPAKTNTSLAAIWLKHPAPIVPAFIKRTPQNTHEVYVLEELKLRVTGNDEQDILNLSKLFNKVVENMILQAPEQYFWLHDRWKNPAVTN